MNKKIYKAVVTIDTGSEEPAIVAEVALPECRPERCPEYEGLIRFFRHYSDTQCMKIGYKFYSRFCFWFGPPLADESLALGAVVRMVLRHPLATFGLLEVVDDFP